MKYLFFIIFFGAPILAKSQFQIHGTVIDSLDNSPVSAAIVTAFYFNDDKLFKYTQTGTTGEFTLSIPPEIQIFTLKIRRIGYAPYEIDIVLSENKNIDKINLSTVLIPISLNEIVIKEKPSPIIIKQDTIIYNIQEWQEFSDQTLEDVLKKIPGFKIKADGSIEHNGRNIDKVVINGKEVSNAGAGILTKSINPERVANIEVRLKEKNQKLKESLLDSNEVVVLDINLKSNLDHSFFGKVRGTVGIQNNSVMPGTYSNFFKLDDKFSNHFFLEHDALGNEEISISHIRNLGKDALQKLFNIPADFQEMVSREEFNQEMYGFKDFIQKERNIAGLTSKYSLSEKTDIFVGTYNSFNKDGLARNSILAFNQSPISSTINETQNNIQFYSKNKLEIRYDANKTKTRFDLNFEYFNDDFQSLNDEIDTGNKYFFERGKDALEIYNNFFYEYLLNKKMGVQLKSSYSRISAANTNSLTHNDLIFKHLLFDKDGNPIFNFLQNTFTKSSNFITEVFGNYKSKTGIWNIGSQYQITSLSSEKKAFDLSSDYKARVMSSEFNAALNHLSYSKYTPYLSNNFKFADINFNSKIGLGIMNYPSPSEHIKTSHHLVEYNISMNYQSLLSNFNFSIQRQLSSFPLYKLMPGFDFLDFRTIAAPLNHLIVPMPERTISFTYGKFLESINTNIIFALINGKTFQGDQFLLDDAPFVIKNYSQLMSNYYAGELQLKKSFKNSLNIEFVQSYLTNAQENIISQGDIIITSTDRFLTELNGRFFSKKSFIGIDFENKHSLFMFSNNGLVSSNQNLFSSFIGTRLKIIDNKVVFNSGARFVTFYGDNPTNILVLNAKSIIKLKKLGIHFEADNLLNNSFFIRQNINPAFFVTEQQSLFGRYFKLGIEYYIN
jgi:hypothetical protein